MGGTPSRAHEGAPPPPPPGHFVGPGGVVHVARPREARWYHKWETWLLIAAIAAVVLPALAWWGVAQYCIYQCDTELTKLRAAGFSVTRAAYEAELTLRWFAAREASPVRWGSVRLGIYGARLASLRLCVLAHMPDAEQENRAAAASGLDPLRQFIEAESSLIDIQKTFGRLSWILHRWPDDGETSDSVPKREMSAANAEVLLPQVYPMRLAALERDLLGLDPPGEDALRGYQRRRTHQVALDLHALTFLVLHRPDDAVAAWEEAGRRPRMQVQEGPFWAELHPQILAMAVRSGQLRAEHYVRLLALPPVMEDATASAREVCRQAVALTADDTRYYRDFAFAPQTEALKRLRSSPHEAGEISIRAYMPRQYSLVEYVRTLRLLEAYDETIRWVPTPGATGPADPSPVAFPSEQLQLEMPELLDRGADIVRIANLRRAILAYGLWRARNGGRRPAKLDDFADAEMKTALIFLSNNELQYYTRADGSAYIASVCTSVAARYVRDIHVLVDSPQDKPVTWPVKEDSGLEYDATPPAPAPSPAPAPPQPAPLPPSVPLPAPASSGGGVTS